MNKIYFSNKGTNIFFYLYFSQLNHLNRKNKMNTNLTKLYKIRSTLNWSVYSLYTFKLLSTLAFALKCGSPYECHEKIVNSKILYVKNENWENCGFGGWCYNLIILICS